MRAKQLLICLISFVFYNSSFAKNNKCFDSFMYDKNSIELQKQLISISNQIKYSNKAIDPATDHKLENILKAKKIWFINEAEAAQYFAQDFKNSPEQTQIIYFVDVSINWGDKSDPVEKNMRFYKKTEKPGELLTDIVSIFSIGRTRFIDYGVLPLKKDLQNNSIVYLKSLPSKEIIPDWVDEVFFRDNLNYIAIQ